MKSVQKKTKWVAMIGHKFIPSRDGGVEVVVSNLAPHLVKMGYDVTCYNRTNKQFKKLRRTEGLMREYQGVHLIWTPTIDRRGLAAMTSSIIASIMVSFRRCDLVHFHTEGPCILCWLPKLMGKKVVVTVHGLDHMRQKWGKFASMYIMQGEKAAVRHELPQPPRHREGGIDMPGGAAAGKNKVHCFILFISIINAPGRPAMR
jgi:glycosyltransferase involved in cell wall biosynthesis